MNSKLLLLMALLIISGCDDVPGQYRHDKNHHGQQDLQSNTIKSNKVKDKERTRNSVNN